MSRAALCVCFSLLAASTLAASESSWKATSVLSVGDRIPDDPALLVQAIGQAFWCPPDMVVAWVRVGALDAPGAWLLVSIRAGVVRSIIREGSESRSKYGTPDLPPVRIVHGSSWIGETSIVPGWGRALLQYGWILDWNGESLRPVALKGGGIRVGDKAHELQRLRATQILGVDENGSFVLSLPIAKPVKQQLVAIYDDRGFTPRPAGAPDDLYGSNSTPETYVVRAAQPNGSTLLALRTPAGQTVLRPAFEKVGVFRQYPGIFLAQSPPLYLYMTSLATGANVWEIGPRENQTVFDSFWLVGPDGAHREVAKPAGMTLRVRILFPRKLQLVLPPLLAPSEVAPGPSDSPVSPDYAVKVVEMTDRVAAGFVPRFRSFSKGLPGTLVTQTANVAADTMIDFSGQAAIRFSEYTKAGIDWFTARGLFLPAGASAMVPVPDLSTDRGPVSLQSVLGFVDDDRAIGVMGDSIVTLARLP